MTQEVKTNDMCTICWKDLPPLLDETNLVQKAAAPILHKADSGFIHRLCGIECARTLFSARRLFCPVNGCDEPLTENLIGMDKRISELFSQTLLPEDAFAENLPPEECLRLWLLNTLDGLPGDYNEDQQNIREHPEEWHREERLFFLAWTLALREGREQLWLNAMCSCAERDPSSFRRSMLATLFDCAILLCNREELERVIRLSYSHSTIERLTLGQLGSLLRTASDVSYDLSIVLFSCIHRDDRSKVLAFAIDDVGNNARHVSVEERLEALRNLFRLMEGWLDQGGEFVKEVFNSPSWVIPEHMPILLDFCERRGIVLDTVTKLSLLTAAIASSSQELAGRILDMNEDGGQDLLHFILIYELNRDNIPEVPLHFQQILALMQEKNLLAHCGRFILRGIGNPAQVSLFLSTCKEQRVRLSPIDLSAGLQNMLGVDLDVCETILSMAESKEALFDNLMIDFLTDRQFQALLDLLQGSFLERFLEKNIRFLPHSKMRLLFNCIEERGMQLSVNFFSLFLFAALGSNDDDFVKHILSSSVSSQIEVISLLAEDLCMRWRWDEGRRSKILGALASLLELASEDGNYESLKETIIQFSDPDLLEEISNAPEWWILQDSSSSQGCPIF